MRTIRAVEMTCGSVCSGIEAASVAWAPLGWRPAWFAEIERFPSAVLAHRFPETPNYGDFTQIPADAPAIDLLVGGTPCQSFSVAGLRGGLADPRGNVALEYLRLAGRLRPRWVVWENVPGVLSSSEGRDFGAFLGGLAELGYGFAYRVLDAQHFGVPQRRRRVFVVGHLGSWQRAAAVLFERHSLQGHPPPSREAREEVAGCLGGGAGERGWAPDTDRMTFVPDVSPALKAHDYKGPSSDGDDDGDGAPLVAHALRADGFDASEDGTGRGTPLVVVPILEAGARCGKHGGLRDGLGVGRPGDPMFTLQSAHQHAVASFDERCITSPGNRSRVEVGRACHTLHHAPPTLIGAGVRRLTPRECERLQGFPDDWTLVPYRGKPAADGPRYRAIGNSMAVPVMRWIGERIQAVDQTGNAVSVRTAKALCGEVLG